MSSSLYTNSDEIVNIQKTIIDLRKHCLENQKSISQPRSDYSENNSHGSSNSNSNDGQHLIPHAQLERLKRDLSSIKGALDKQKEFQKSVANLIEDVDHCFEDVVNVARGSCESQEQGPIQAADDLQLQTKLHVLNKLVTKLKVQVGSVHKISSATSDTHHRDKLNSSTRTSSGSNTSNLFGLGLNHHPHPVPEISQENFDSLDSTYKNCLLCFAAFPENEVVKKRFLISWWVAEGFVVRPSDGEKSEKTAEDIAGEILENLKVKGFIEPVQKKRRPVTDTVKMHPSVRSLVIQVAQECEFFVFDPNGTVSANFLSSHRACLVESEQGSFRKAPINSPDLDQGKIKTLLNVSEGYLNFKLETFSKMKKLNVLYLGRWQRSAKHHIEVEDTEFLKGLKYMKHLKFLSLHGISRIMELPNSICKATNLRSLDLRACHNLEVLPDGIGSLKELTHLDVSECYLLDGMPKGIASLTKLQVLKGFVIGDPKSRSLCTLDHLANLKKLKKLSISTGWEDFPTDKEVGALQKLKALRKLTIAWGEGTMKSHRRAATRPSMDRSKTLSKNKSLRKTFTIKRDEDPDPAPALPTELVKLDLQCFPLKIAPTWLKPEKLMSLKKLYIRGGNLCSLSQSPQQVACDEHGWKVEILRLKFLCGLKMDWRELQALFPDLIYVEKVFCPKLTFFPCDGSGVWVNKNNGNQFP